MRSKIFLSLSWGLFLLGSVAQADSPLKSQLDLDVEQARQVQEIQGEYRRIFSAKRQEFNRESRALRRARSANDSELITELEQTTADLQEDLKQIRLDENGQIREILTPEQNEKFDMVIQQRRAMVGSSRDVDIFEP